MYIHFVEKPFVRLVGNWVFEQFWVSLGIHAADSDFPSLGRAPVPGWLAGLGSGAYSRFNAWWPGDGATRYRAGPPVGKGRSGWVSLSRAMGRLSLPAGGGGGHQHWQSVIRLWVLPSLGTGLFKSSVNTAHCASHFLCEESHRQAQLHLHEKPHGPTDFPQVWFDQKYIWFPASMLWSRLPFVSLNFRITVDKSMSQPLVIGVFFFFFLKMIHFTHFPILLFVLPAGSYFFLL